jgi:DNA-binding transcriptional MerR regulator
MSTIAKYSIKDLEVLSDIKSHTIRIWEKRYNLLQPERTDTNIRFYSNDDLKKLLNVSFLNQNGFKISKIAQMSEVEINDKVRAVNLAKTDDNTYIENLIVAMIEINEPYFNKIINSATVKFGFEQCVSKVIFPFFARIGVMWQTDAINPAQEHFVSNIIRQKIISAIDAVDTPANDKLPKVLLFLPESEMHELALLFYNYVLKNNGYTTVYLGQSLPLDSLPRIIEIVKPKALVYSIVSTLNSSGASEIVSKINTFFKGEVFVSGAAAHQLPENKLFNQKRFKTAQELLILLKSS